MATKDLIITDRQKVRDALGKSESDVIRDIEIIKEWMKTQPHLPEMPSDRMIELFLVMNRFSIERTKPKLDMYYSIRPLMPEIYKDKHPRMAHMRDIFKTVYAFALPKATPDLCRIHVLKITGDPEDFDGYNLLAHLLNTTEVKLQEDLAVRQAMILDLEDVKIGHVRKFTFMHVKKIAIVSEKVFSDRMKEIHILKAPVIVDTLMNICKAALNPKLVSRMYMHNSVENLHQYITKEILPKDYGGDERSLQELNDLWKIKLEEYSDRFDQLEKMKVNEELRPEPLKNDDILGFHGNFKQLDVD